MEIFYINYPNGGMGNTVLAHILYACHKAVIDVDSFFCQESGNAHKIGQINRTQLQASHEEFIPFGSNVLINIVCEDWDEVLRKKFSYSKWFKSFPCPGDFKKFSFTEPKDQESWLENLVYKYFDSFIPRSRPPGFCLQIGDYILGNIDEAKSTVEKKLGWHWDDVSSITFHKAVLEHNRSHLEWLDSIRILINDILTGVDRSCDLEFWERALVLSLVCYKSNISPSLLPWADEDRFLVKDTVALTHSLKWIKNGQTF